MQDFSLDQWLQWLERNHPVEIELGLDRVKEVARRLNLLNPSALVITVAGTNGKGSCVTATAALLQAAGHQVGVYMSPHLHSYNERIRINGVDATDKEICDAFWEIYQASQHYESAPSISLTYFEFGTLAALCVFRRRNVSAMVLEVGLGGRLDAVNIIDADIAVITTIALDHTDWLGDTREQIGFEKAGIMRLNKPVVCADRDLPQSLMDHAASLNAPLHCLGEAFDFTVNGDSWKFSLASSSWASDLVPQLPLPSVASALYVCQLLKLPLPMETALAVVGQLRMMGRFQRCRYNEREVILDVAHNPAATGYLSERLSQLPATGSTYAIIAMMVDKDRRESLSNLMEHVDGWYIADLSHVPRAATVDELTNDLAVLGQAPLFAGIMSDCLNHVMAISSPEDRILVCGSFFTVAAALQYLGGFNQNSGLVQ